MKYLRGTRTITSSSMRDALAEGGARTQFGIWSPLLVGVQTGKNFGGSSEIGATS